MTELSGVAPDILVYTGLRTSLSLSLSLSHTHTHTRICKSSADNKEFLCVTHTVEHNYISLSSIVGIQLHVSALYVGHLQVVI